MKFKSLLERIGVHGISDVGKYNDSMAKSMLDKLFFLGPEVRLGNGRVILVDFGCANGKMLRSINSRMDGRLNFGENNVVKLIGYDLDPDMIRLAKAENAAFRSTTSFSTRWSALAKYLRAYNRDREYTTVLCLSSVLHEVYSYSSSGDVAEFWGNIAGGLFDYIVIRDMAPGRSLDSAVSREADVLRVQEWCRRNGFTERLAQFERIHGRIGAMKQLVHFLLKYTYVENWEREVREDYLPVSSEEVRTRLGSAGYSIVSSHEYILSHIAERTTRDFGIRLDVPTHLKLIAAGRGVGHQFRRLSEEAAWDAINAILG